MTRRLKTVMAFGTFDLLHPGHVDFLRQAKALGDELVVSVARDENAKKFKGMKPVFSEKERLRLVASLSMVDRAILGSKKNYLTHILSESPDVIAVGYDQKAYVPELKKDIADKNLSIKITRLKAYKSSRYKSSNFKMIIKKS